MLGSFVASAYATFYCDFGVGKPDFSALSKGLLTLLFILHHREMETLVPVAPYPPFTFDVSHSNCTTVTDSFSKQLVWKWKLWLSCSEASKRAGHLESPDRLSWNFYSANLSFLSSSGLEETQFKFPGCDSKRVLEFLWFFFSLMFLPPIQTLHLLFPSLKPQALHLGGVVCRMLWQQKL